MNILFLCTGNVSRSFLAEMLLKNEIKKHNLEDISVMSAGVSAYPGAHADPNMVDFLIAKGIQVDDHRSRLFGPEDIVWADRILVMEKMHLSRIEDHWPEAKDKTELLGAYISPGSFVDDITDPYGGSSYHYRLAQSQITLAIKNLVAGLARE